MRMMVAMNGLDDEKKDDDKPEEPKLDGMPESFIGPLLADRDDASVISLRRPHIAGVVPTLATLVTGVSASRHQIQFRRWGGQRS